ncbi:hypothetical protein [Streptomyces sp. NPDC088762]|uniref:D-alanyl-D-alanine carboxypeptidase family protein n=1 Tax=Streptomyces sp. NPDC088762 TaxID=3365891 RepID=UPI0037F3513B
MESAAGSATSGSGSAEPAAASADSDLAPAFRAAKASASAPDAPAEESDTSERTTAFRAAKDPAPASDSPAGEPGAAKGSASAGAEGSASERTAVFRAVKPPTAGKSAPAAAAAGASAAKDDSASEAADSERTAVFRTVKPVGKPDAGATPDTPAEESSDSERTAVFRAVKPPAPASPAEPSDSERTAVFRAVKPGSGSGGAPREDAAVREPAERERTGVFRLPKEDSASADAKSASVDAKSASTGAKSASPDVKSGSGDVESADSERTAAFRAVKPKASTFVPLRTDEPGSAQEAKAPAPAAPSRTPAAMDRVERTTQQPLPPKPPLDMLADLTNNPPPPPSPMRTAIRRFKIYFPLVVLLAIILAVVQLVRPLPEPKLVMTAKSSYTFGGSKPELPWPGEGQAYMAAAGLGTLGQSGEQKPVPIASVTKSMTAYIILRDHPVKKGEKGAMIDVDKTAESEGKKNNSTDNESTLDTVQEGQKISEYDAIAALMIPSANNIARLLARWDSGSQEAFVKKMNDTAKELGMSNTTYTDPSGLDATTVSTAEDQVKLGLKLVEMETLLEITKKPEWIDPSGKKWRNWNGLVPFNDSLGIKTGTTTKAGGNLLFAAQKKIGNTNQLIVGAVLGQHKPPIIDSVLAASKQLMIATQKALEGAPVVKKGDVVGYVDDGLGGRTPVVATADVQAIGWAALTVDVKLGNGGGKLPQTAKAGTEVGLLTVGEGASQVKVPVALKSDLAAPGIGSKLTRVG